MNYSDTARIVSILDANNYKQVSSSKEANLLIINTCGIRQSAENRAYSLINNAKDENKTLKVLLTGCLSRRTDVKRRLANKVDYFMPISELPHIIELLSGNTTVSNLSLDEVRLRDGEKYLNILPSHSNSFSALVPIGNGCNNFCSYCVVPYARGREVYRSAKDIISEVRSLIKQDYREIILIAQNVNSYQFKDYDFPKLLSEVAELPGDFLLRFFTSHPKDVSLELIRVMSNYEKICPHLHLALQSGDDQILQAMNRGYRAKHFLDIVDKVRASRDDMSISTDIIVGYPGETKDNFQNTVSVFKRAKFDLAYISRYSPRPGTASATLEDDVSAQEKARREKVLEEIMFTHSHNVNQKLLGAVLTILVEGKNRKGKYYGKTANNKMVQIRAEAGVGDEVMGTFIKVNIKSAGIMGLEGEIA